LFKVLLAEGIIEEEKAVLSRGNPTALCRLTQKGSDLAVFLGQKPGRGLPKLLGRHRSLSQALLALLARDVLERWGYVVDLWMEGMRFPSGCYPDLVARADGVEIYVELEMEPVVASERVYRRNDERVRKWQIFHRAGGGCLYIVLPSPSLEMKMIAEIAVWQAIARLPVRLFTTNVVSPGSTWQEKRIP